MKKVCFILPYFGKFPNYFQLFLNSCKYNSNYNWLIITDNNDKYDYPENVKKILTSFGELKRTVQSKFDFTICLSAPYKLCDYKPAYGYLFEKYLKEFDYWGYCDLDIILGNLDHFLPKLLYKNYDKIFTLGHFQLYKNTKDNNRIFMKMFDGQSLYKKAFSTNRITVFDETRGDNLSINDIYLEKKLKVYQEDLSFNIKVTPTKFTRVKYNYQKNSFDSLPTQGKTMIIWCENGLFTCSDKKNHLMYNEYLYIHLQQRRMKILNIEHKNVIVIIPNAFYGLNKMPKTVQQFNSLKKRTFNFHKIRIVLKWKFLRLKRIFSKGD